MSFLKRLLTSGFKQEKNNTASVAKDRLQLIIINEKSGDSDLSSRMPQLQKEILEILSKYVNVQPNDIKVCVEQQDDLEVLEVKVELHPS